VNTELIKHKNVLVVLKRGLEGGKMVRYNTKYIATKRNAQILADKSEVFGQDQSSTEAKLKHGSFNFFTITNFSTSAVRIKLDGQDDRNYPLAASI